MRTGWDCDGVGHTFSAGVHDHLICTGQGELWKSGPNPEPYWDWYKDWGWTDEQFVAFCHEAADHGCLFTGHVREGYREAIDAVANAGHEIVVVTDRAFGSSPEVSERLTEDWFRHEQIWYDELIFSADKTVGDTDVFIDDKIENYDALQRAGTNVFLLNRPWNKVEEFDYRKRVDSVTEYADLILKFGDRLKRKTVYVSN